MKKIILIALMGVLSLTCFSQVTIESPTDSKGNTAGFYLDQAGQYKCAKLIVLGAGSLMTNAFVFHELKKPFKQDYKYAIGTASTTVVVALLCELASGLNLMRAGRLMDGKEGLSLKTQSGNLGLAYNF